MNQVNQHWRDERGESNLDNAIDAILAEPIDECSVDRVAQRALHLGDSSTTTSSINNKSTIASNREKWLRR